MEEGTYEKISMKELKVGRFVIVDEIACKVVDIETSSPGKHGAAKMRITAIGVFDGQKKQLIKPSSADIEIPVIKKMKAQVVSVGDKTVQVMDSTTYEVFDLPITEEFEGKLTPGKEVEVMEAMGRKALMRTY